MDYIQVGNDLLVDALTLLPTALPAELAEMHLADAPDYPTAVAAGIAHGLTPQVALKSAYGKWLTDHADAAQEFGLASFYDGKDASKAMVNNTSLTQYLAIMVAELGRRVIEQDVRIAALEG